MATKNNPGRFDCYAAARPDEQMFTLLERDPMAPYLVAIWAQLRLGNPVEAKAVFDTMCAKLAGRYLAEPDSEKGYDAMDCARAMFRAQEERG
jgi:hypothetical protein